MSTQTFLIDATTRHAVFLQRYAGGQAKKAQKTLSRLRSRVVGRIANEPTEFQAKRLNALLADLDQLLVDGFGNIAIDVKSGMYDLAANEAGFSTDLYGKSTNVDFVLPSNASLVGAVENTKMPVPLDKGMTLNEALEEFGKKKAAQIRQLIRDGVALGDTTPKIASDVSSMMGTLQKREVDAIVRTATNFTSSVARAEVYNQNAAILDGYEWVSTLDGRTTLVCAGRDGEIYQMGVGPMPPAHFNCRSTTIPVVKEEFSLTRGQLGGSRASKGATGSKKVNAKTTYGGWLKRQPKEFVDEALGPERSKLFRSGKLSIDKFTDPTGRVYTLQELANMNQIAFIE